MNHANRLAEKTRFMRARTFHVTTQFLRHDHLAQLFPEFLFRSQCIVRAIVPLMEEAIRVARQKPEDPVSTPLIDYLLQHIEEERDHDEWCIRDLGALGMTRAEVFARMPPPNVAAMVGAQYYWVRHHHPISILGYLASIDLYPPSVQQIEEMIRATGLPRPAFESMLVHARIDQDHKTELIQHLNAMPLTEEHHAVLELSSFHTFRYLALILEDVLKLAPATEPDAEQEPTPVQG